MYYTIVVQTPFSDEEDGEYGERSFEVQAGSPTEAMHLAESKISIDQGETIIQVEFAGDD